VDGRELVSILLELNLREGGGTGGRGRVKTPRADAMTDALAAFVSSFCACFVAERTPAESPFFWSILLCVPVSVLARCVFVIEAFLHTAGSRLLATPSRKFITALCIEAVASHHFLLAQSMLFFSFSFYKNIYKIFLNIIL